MIGFSTELRGAGDRARSTGMTLASDRLGASAGKLSSEPRFAIEELDEEETGFTFASFLDGTMFPMQCFLFLCTLAFAIARCRRLRADGPRTL